MKKIALTQGQFALVDDDMFEELNKFKWHADKNYNTFYAVRNEGKSPHQKKIRMHRLIMGVTDGKIQIDHKYGNGLDNRKKNLRICTNSENQINKKSKIGGTSKYKGVSWKTLNNKWNSKIGINGGTIQIGLFINEIEAAKAYNLKATELFGEFARLNTF